MPRLLHVLADTLVTLLGFALLAFSVWRIQVDASALGPMLVAFSVLAINLLAALLVKTRLRREPGLLLLHVGLLALVFLAGAGRLGRYEATVEIVDGQRYSDALPIALTHGPWYRPERHRLEFIQGGYRVDYAPGLRRGDTRSQVQVADVHLGQQGRRKHASRSTGQRHRTRLRRACQRTLTRTPSWRAGSNRSTRARSRTGRR